MTLWKQPVNHSHNIANPTLADSGTVAALSLPCSTDPVPGRRLVLRSSTCPSKLEERSRKSEGGSAAMKRALPSSAVIVARNRQPTLPLSGERERRRERITSRDSLLVHRNRRPLSSTVPRSLPFCGRITITGDDYGSRFPAPTHPHTHTHPLSLFTHKYLQSTTQ
jgi:hypothetical protein